MRHAVIMAGGTGTRLWPLSRKAAPKQFQKLIGDQTLIQQAYNRIRQVLPAEQIWVMTGEQYADLTKEQLLEINPHHILTEPSARNSAPATILATMRVTAEDPDAVLFGLLPADHYVGLPHVFAETTTAMFEFIETQPQYVGTLGIYPTEPATGYGYIKKGETLGEYHNQKVFAVESFHEKPELKTAKKFLNSGRYLWNGGYYLFNGAQMLVHAQNLLPDTYQKLAKFIQTGDRKLYESIQAEPIDTAISEKLKDLAVITADMEWSDVGNWATLHEILNEHSENNHAVKPNHVSNNSENTLVMGGNKLIATVGLKDVVVIDTEDIILVCHKDSVQDVKKIVEQLEKQGEQQFL